jgi:hypothetical protein
VRNVFIGYLVAVLAGCAPSVVEPKPSPKAAPVVAVAASTPEAQPVAPDSGGGSVGASPERLDDLLTLVASSTEADFVVEPLPDGALIGSRSLLATVVGAEVRQDPRWLSGLPEYVNWDAGLYLRVPPSGAASRGELPKGAFLSMIAGNTHGAGGDFVWNGARWVGGRMKRDARVEPLFEKGHASAEAVEFSTGEALIVKMEEGGVHSYAFEARQKRATRVRLPFEKNPWDSLASLTAASLRDAYFCSRDAMVHFDGVAWTPVPLPEKASLFSCAMTRDGTVWVIDRGKVVRRTQAGEWGLVELPSGSNVTSLAAAGDRVWVSSDAEERYELRSTTPVTQPIEVGPDELPLAWFASGGGITGLDDFVPDAPSVSANPSGPGTSACRSLVLYLGRTLTPEIRTALAAVPEASSASLVEVRGRAKGRLRMEYVGGRSSAVVVPSQKLQTAFALIPADYARGKAVARALSAGHLPSLEPKLLCAVPEIVRKIP